MVDRLVNSEANAKRIHNVETCFGISGKSLAVPGRVLVGEGVLTKMCRKKPKPRQVFLFNDILLYGSIIINKKKYNRQHIIRLENIKLDDIVDEGELKNGWLIKTPTKSFAVYAATETEKVEWMAHINKCMQDLISKTGSRPASEHAAVWIPDSASPICMHCKKTQFTVINRRHHCRNCGTIVCGSCSKNKFLIPSLSSKPVRVCNGCYETLGKAKMFNYSESLGRKVSCELTSDGYSQSQSHSLANSNTNERAVQENESSESDEDKEPGLMDDINKSLENLTIEEKPTFYSEIDQGLVESGKVASDIKEVNKE